MNKEEKKLTPAQFTFFLIQTQIGISVLSLPNELAVIAKNDSWIAILVAGFIVQIDILIIWLLAKRFPHWTLYEILPALLGKPIGKAVHVIYIFFNFCTVVLITILFTHLLDVWIFNSTPNLAINLLILVMGVYIAVHSLVVISRFYMFVSLLLVVPLILSLYVLTDVNWFYILPIGSGGGTVKILEASSHSLFALLGFELLMVLYPHVATNSVGKLKSSLISNAFVTLFYCFLTIISMIYFSPQEIILVPQPVLYMLKEFSFSLIERTDLVFISIWVTCIVTSFTTYLYLTGTGFNQSA